MNKKLLLGLVLLVSANYASSQNVNGLLIDATNTATRDASAAFEIIANTNTPGSPLYGGFLPPRVALTGTTDVTTISGTEATGLTVFNTVTAGDVTPGYYYWSGSAWVRMLSGSFPTTVKWNAITAPDGDLTLAHANYSTTFTFNGTTVGSAWNMSSNSVTTGRLADLSISGAATSGGVLNLSGSNTTPANFVGTVLYATSNGTAPSNGYAYFNFTGDHSGNGLLVRDVTTAGNASAVIANNLTTGTGLSLSSTGTIVVGGEVLNVAANNATTGSAMRIQANGLTSGSALEITSTGTATSNARRLISLQSSGANAAANGVAVGVDVSVTNTGTTLSNTAGRFIASSASAGATNRGLDVRVDGATTGSTNNAINIYAPSSAVTNTAGTVSIDNIEIAPAAIIQNGAGSTTFWTGLDLNMPTQTQTAGTIISRGINITGGTVNSGTAYAITTSASAGNVGIGSTTPTSTLKIEGSIAPKYVSTAANPYNVTQSDYYINYNTSGGVINLPSSGTGIPGRLLNIKNTTSGTVTVNAVGGELIDGAASYTLNANNSLQLINNGTPTGAVTTWNVMEVSLTGGLLASGFAAPVANSVTISAPTAGSATTALRSDATLQLSQAIVPTWTGTHTFSNAAAIRMSNGTVALPAIAFTASTGTGLSSPAVNVLAISTAGAERARIDASGNFGIGVTPSGVYKLQVSGKLLTSGIDENSDARLKKDVNPIYDALSKVTRMRGVTYNWRTEEFPERNFEKDMQFGLIAQELEKIIPELVTTDGDGYKAIEYSHLVPVLIEAIKELDAKNNEQKVQLDQQTKTNDELKASIENLLIRMNTLENNVEVKTNKAAK